MEKKFIINNVSQKTICRVRVDNCLIKDQNTKKCDFLFNVQEDNKYFLVELKGADIFTAIKQIESTFDNINQQIKASGSDYTGIVVSSSVPKLSTLKFQNLTEKLYRNKSLLIKRKSFIYEEKV